MRKVLTNLLGENGRPKKLLIPPRTTRECKIDYISMVSIQEMRFEIYIAPRLALLSVFLVQTGPLIKPYELSSLLLYNGGWESQWIEHGDNVANIFEFRT